MAWGRGYDREKEVYSYSVFQSSNLIGGLKCLSIKVGIGLI